MRALPFPTIKKHLSALQTQLPQACETYFSYPRGDYNNANDLSKQNDVNIKALPIVIRLYTTKKTIQTSSDWEVQCGSGSSTSIIIKIYG